LSEGFEATKGLHQGCCLSPTLFKIYVDNTIYTLKFADDQIVMAKSKEDLEYMGQRCEVTEAVKLHVKLLSFPWDHEFKVLRGGPFPAILGLNFLDRTKMVVDVASRKFSFGFAPSCFGTFSVSNLDIDVEPYLQNLCEEASNRSTVSEVWPSGMSSSSIMADFPALFSPTLGTANCTRYEDQLSDPTPVRSSPYRCSPPKL
jgi:hypothetical protein